MAAYYGPIGGVLHEDINRAARQIAQSSDTDDKRPRGQLGSALNEWQRPVTEVCSDPKWVVKLKSSPYIDFGRKEWARSRDAVDAVMDLLLKEMRAKAAAQYEHLRIDSYIRKGSSRDGLKVIKPDEFDTAIEFHIEGIQLSEKHINKDGKYVPGFCYIKVEQRREVLQNSIQSFGGKVYSKKIHRDAFALALECYTKEYLNP